MDDASLDRNLTPPWWAGAHGLVALFYVTLIALSVLGVPWVVWLTSSAVALVAALGLRWQMGMLDSTQGRGRTLLLLLWTGAGAGFIYGLSLLHLAFAGAFVAWPLLVGQYTRNDRQAPWTFFAALFSCLLFLSTLDVRWAIALVALSFGAAATAYRFQRTEAVRRDIPDKAVESKTTGRVELLAKPVGEQSAHDVTIERLHEMVSIVRAATRARLAAIYWLDDAQQVLIPAVIETANPQKVYDGPIAVDTAFHNVDIFADALTQCTLQQTPTWYLEAETTAQPPNVMVAHIQDEGILLGVLIVERTPERGAFHKADQIAVAKCAHLAAMQRRDEQAAISAAKTAHDLQVVAHAAEQLSDTLNEDEVYRIGATLYGDLVPGVDVAFVRQTHDDGLEIAYLSEQWTDFSVGDTLPTDHSLVVRAMERRHALPYRAGGENDDPSLFGLPARRDDLHRHLVYPLISGRIAHSAVILRVSQRGVFHRTARERLGLLSNQIAAALGIARAYETMAQRAAHDGMTQLLNRASFEEQSTQALQRAMRLERPLSLLIMDIDHFKSVNDTYGHAVGDEVIRAVASTIRSQVRRIDIAARYGGEEFVVVLEDTDTQGAYLFAERLRERVGALMHQSEQQAFRATISIGVASFPTHAAHIQTLLEYADAALYQSKRAGRNRVTIWSAADQEATDYA